MFRKLPRKKLVLLVGDIFAVVASLYITSQACSDDYLQISTLRRLHFFILLTHLFSLYLFDCYNFDYRFNSIPFVLRLFSAFVIPGMCVFVVLVILHDHPRLIFLGLQELLIFLPVLSCRLLLGAWFNKRLTPDRVIILGAGRNGQMALRLLKENRYYRVIGILDDNPELHETKLSGIPVEGGSELIPKLVATKQVDIILVAILREIEQEVYRLLAEAKMHGVSVEMISSFFESEMQKIPVLYVNHRWFVYMPVSVAQRNFYNGRLKRLFDIVCSFSGLVLLSPLLLLTAAAIRIESPGPIFFLQRRIGHNEQSFQMIKFRSMRIGLENERQFAGQRKDPRITRVGRVIRLFRIDELPQLLNVLKGEMSLIGPRPLIEDEVQAFAPKIPYYNLRHCLRPGITGWAQVNYPHGVTEKDALEKLEYDLFYIKNLSILLDLHIVLRTIRTVVFSKGAR